MGIAARHLEGSGRVAPCMHLYGSRSQPAIGSAAYHELASDRSPSTGLTNYSKRSLSGGSAQLPVSTPVRGRSKGTSFGGAGRSAPENLNQVQRVAKGDLTT